MKVLMIGTPLCTKCKAMRPKIEYYCSEHGISFRYEDLSHASKDILEILVSKNIKSAPAFLIYKKEDESPVVVSGDNIYLELQA